MRKHSLILALVLAPALGAQTQPAAPRIETSTDFSVLALSSTGRPALDGVPSATAVGRGLAIGARTGDRQASASATTHVQPVLDRQFGVGMQIDEHGLATSNDANSHAQAGTSDSTPRTNPPAFGAHGVRATFAARPGATGVVIILLDGRSSANAHCAAFVDVDGDGTPDWRAAVNGTTQAARFQVTAGRQGIVVGAYTDGRAGIRGQGQEGYGASLRVFFRADATAPTCTWTSFSRPCGATLVGSDQVAPGGVRIQLDVSGAPASALGLMVIGNQLRAPAALPFSRCDLLVDPRITIGFVTDAAGAATMPFGIHSNLRGLDVNFQAVVIGFDPARNPTVAASNGENLTCN